MLNHRLRICGIWLAILCLRFHLLASVPELHTVADIRNLTEEQAAEGRPVHLTGTITFYDPAQPALFMQDSTGAIFIQVDERTRYSVVAGSRVEIWGQTGSGYSTQVNNPRIEETSRGPLPKPLFIDYQKAAKHDNDCRFVTMEGVVRSATFQAGVAPIYLIQMETEGHTVDVAISNFPRFDPETLLDATIRVTGNLSGNINPNEQIVGLQLLVTDSSQLQVLHQATADPAGLPITSLPELLHSDQALSGTHRVHTRGILTLYDPGEKLVIQEGNSSLLIQTRQLDPFRIGQQVEVTGFPAAINGSLSMAFGQILSSGNSVDLAPQQISFANALTGKYGNDLVSIDGTLVSETRTSHLDTLTVRADGQVFQALFRKVSDVDPIPFLEPGTRLRLTGICMVQVRGFWGAIDSFDIHLRSSRDIEVLALPSWWTVRHMLYVISALLGIALVAIVWGLWMRRRLSLQEKLVRQKIEAEAATMIHLAQLERQRSRILELIKSYEPLQTVFTAIHAHAAELWPEAISYSHILQDRKLTLIASSHPASLDEARLQVIDAIHSTEPCAIAVRTRSLATDSGKRTIWSRPLVASNGEILGALTFESAAQQQSLNQDAFDFGCNIAVVAIDNRRLYEDAIHRSLHDHLTGLANRALLDQRLEEAVGRAKTAGYSVAVLFLDLDRFKAVNDCYSHRIGDLYLSEVARRFHSCLRSCDTLSRFGGDEFVAVVTNLVSTDEAETVAQRLLMTMRTPIVVEGITLHGSVSIGMTIFPRTGITPNELKQQADAAMYEAKRTGGDRVVLFSEMRATE